MLELFLGFMSLLFFVVPILIILFFSSIKIVNQYEEGVKFRLGKFAGVMKPGVNIVLPFLEWWIKVDMRIKTIDIPKQEVMTKDNVPIMVNGVVYFKVKDTKLAVLEIQDYVYAVAQYAQTALRDVIGGVELDFVLSERDQIAEKIEKLVDLETNPWGIDITAVKMQDIELPTDMKRTMAKQAEAEREKRATIIKSEGEVIASKNLSKAANVLSMSSGALHLRTLHSLNDLSSDQSNTVVFAVPLEVLRAFEGIGDMVGKKKDKR